MSDNSDRYAARGVSAGKEEVHRAIKGLDRGLYPNAFCKILPDIVGGSDEYCNIMHADTAGTKTSLAYLYWKETGDASVWRGIAQDAIVMNTDDMACVGCVDDIVISSTIGRNRHLISGEVLGEIIQGAQEVLDRLNEQGVGITLAGGETADVGDVVRTADVGYTTFARMKRSELVVCDIKEGDLIVGLASYGRMKGEREYNSGIGSNGLTSARHDLLSKHYAKNYPESFDPNTDPDFVFSGSGKLTDEIDVEGEGRIQLGKLLLSPTRSYLPVVKRVLSEMREQLHAIIHCTGGAQTKVLKFMGNTRAVKDDLFPVPPIFGLIQSQSGTTWNEMYKVFNMGHRMEFYLPEARAVDLISICEAYDLPAKVIGRVERSSQPEVLIRSANGEFVYK